MRIFITGASGYLGAVHTEHLIGAGHQVSALVRSEAAREKVTRLGAEPILGSLADLDTVRAAVTEADGVVHAAVDFAHPAMHEIEEPALAAMLDAMKPGRPFVYTSTGLVYPDAHGATVDEDTPVTPEQSPQPFKVLGERQVLAAQGPAVTIIRAALIYGRAGSGLLQGMIAGANERGVVTYIGDGANAWSSVHIDDLARLYTAALVAAEPRLVLNAATAAPTTMREIAEAVADLTGAQPMQITLEQARAALGPFADVLTRSALLDAARAERILGWKPVEPGLIDELRKGSYMEA
jgi:nucleoside-diphosphate-sugar epimerase